MWKEEKRAEGIGGKIGREGQRDHSFINLAAAEYFNGGTSMPLTKDLNLNRSCWVVAQYQIYLQVVHANYTARLHACK